MDDLLLTAPRPLAECLVAMITKVWDCSEPDWAGSTAVKFLGVEVRRTPSGAFHLSQKTYLLDLLQKYPQIEYPAPAPVMPVAVEAEAAATAEDVRAAQGIAGELTWLRSPSLAIKIGYSVLQYLKGSVSVWPCAR